MARRIRWSTFWKVSLVAACVTAAATAQRPRVAGGPVHVSAPPVYRQPIFHAPVSYAPISSSLIATSPTTVFPAGGLGFFRRPIRPFPGIIVVYYPLVVGPAPFWQFNSCWWASCDLFWTLGTVTVPYPVYSGPNYVVAPDVEPVVYGEVRPELPELFLNDGTVLSVTDYWLVDGRLHFTMIEQEGGSPVEHDIPFDQLDLQKTKKTSAARGFRFMLRNEPFEQYVRDHPDAPEDSVQHN